MLIRTVSPRLITRRGLLKGTAALVAAGAALPRAAYAACDPSFASVTLLCHCDGANAGTTFVDSSSHAWTMTATNFTTSSTQVLYGTASLSAKVSPVTSGQLLISGAGAVGAGNFGSGQFTVECAIYAVTAPGSGFANACPISQWGSFDETWQFQFPGGSSGSALTFQYSLNGTSATTVTTSFTPSLNTWYQIAVDRDVSGVIRVYAGGVVVGTATDASAFFTNATAITVGTGNANGSPFTGYIDEVRVTKGIARYAGAYTPATAAFPNGSVCASASHALPLLGTGN